LARRARGRAIIACGMQPLRLRCAVVNRTQMLVLAFFLVVLVSVIVIRVGRRRSTTRRFGCRPPTVGWRPASWAPSLR
jgi:hypothetical protein